MPDDRWHVALRDAPARSAMTPERARRLAGRWTLAALALIPVMLVLLAVGLVGLNRPIAIIGGALFASRAAHWIGWARGYEEARDLH